jgi:hypothetical protein
LYPASPVPELTSWDNVRQIHIQGASTGALEHHIKRDVLSSESFRDCVRPSAAISAESLSISVLVRFGKGELYRDTVTDINKVSRLSKEEVRVVGWYWRSDEDDRRKLRAVVERIRKSVLQPGGAKENYLIGGSSGSGKSYLIEELGEELAASGVCFRKVKIPQELLTVADARKLENSLLSETRPVLCLLDEIDSHTEFLKTYSEMFMWLRWRELAKKQIVFVLIGSQDGGVDQLEAAIRQRIKGSDVCEYIATDGKINIPNYKLWDRLLVLISKLSSMLSEKGCRLTNIERLVLYYIAVAQAQASGRAMTALAERIIERATGSAVSVHYDHLFEPDSEARGEFFAEHIAQTTNLRGRFLDVVE